MIEQASVTFQDSKDLQRKVIQPTLSENIYTLGSVQSITKLPAYTLKKSVCLVTFHDRPSVLVKQDAEGIVNNEIDGYALMANSPFHSKILTPIFASKEQSALFLPWLDNMQTLKQLLKKRLLSEQESQVILDDIFDYTKSWWTMQRKNTFSTIPVSWLRRDWTVVKESVVSFVKEFSEKYHIPQDALWEKSLVVNQIKIPSLKMLASMVGEFYSQPLSYTLLSNVDIKGSNILVDENNHWKLIDFEQVGYADPAEAFALSAKQITASSVEVKREQMKVSNNNTEIDISIPASISDDITQLQYHLLSRAQEFTKILGDSSFGQRAYMYLVGNYVEELTLAAANNDLETGLILLSTLESVHSALFPEKRFSDVRRGRDSNP